jgi:hypothetical protein
MLYFFLPAGKANKMLQYDLDDHFHHKNGLKSIPVIVFSAGNQYGMLYADGKIMLF